MRTYVQSAGRVSSRRSRSLACRMLLLSALCVPNLSCWLIGEFDDFFIVKLEPQSMVLQVGESQDLEVQLSTESVNSVEIGFASNDPGVAVVDPPTAAPPRRRSSATQVNVAVSTRVMGVSPGKTFIQVTNPDEPGKVFRMPVEVVSQPRLEIDISPSILLIEPGQTGRISCDVYDEVTGDAVPVLVTYTSSDPTVATVDASGRVTGMSEGVVTITCAAQDAQPVTATVDVRVPRIVEIDPSGASVLVGQIQNFTCTSKHAVTGQPLMDTFTWTTTSRAVAEVITTGSPGNVVVAARGVGTATITCRAPGVSAQAIVTVRAPAFTLEISPASAQLNPGGTVQLSCTVRDAQTGAIVTGQTLTWSSSDEAVATVNNNGLVLAVGNGTADITCRVATGESATARISVSPPASAPPLCDPQRTDTNVLKNLGSILRGDPTSFCANATEQVATGMVTHSSNLVTPRPRALDHTSIKIAGGVPSWSLSDASLDLLNSLYPCGLNTNGMTLCSPAVSGPLPGGDYVMVYTVLHAPFPSMDANNTYQFGFVFDRDADPANNFVPSALFPNDFFKGTDFWIQAGGKPGISFGFDATDATNNVLSTVPTLARLIIDGATLFLLVPRTHFTVADPPVRFSVFRHDGNFGFNGNWDGDVQRPVSQPLYTLPILPATSAAGR